jgi:hypothetical protein
MPDESRMSAAGTPTIERSLRAPAVFLWATAVAALGGPMNLWLPFLRDLVGDDNFLLGLGALAAESSAGLSLLWAYLSDTFRPASRGRERYVLVGSAILVAAWIAAMLVPRAGGPWLAVGVPIGLGATLIKVAAFGALVELARRRRIAGRLAAVLVVLGVTEALVGSPLLGEVVASSREWTAAVGAGFGLSAAFAVTAYVRRGAPPTAAGADTADAPPTGLWAYLRSKPLWTVLILASMSSVGNEVLHFADRWNQTVRTMGPSLDLREQAARFGEVAVVVMAGAYGFCSGRVKTRTLMRASLLAEALGLLLLLVISRADVPGWLVRIAAARGLGGLARVAMIDLALRMAPRGREAFGFALLTGVPPFLGAFLSPFILLSTVGAFGGVVIAVGLAVLAALALALVPESQLGVVDDRAGQDLRRNRGTTSTESEPSGLTKT